MLVRRAQANDDFQAAAQLYLDVWRATYTDMLPAAFLAQLTPATWHPERRWQRTWLAFDEAGQLIGTCAAGPARAVTRSGWGEIYSIYVRPTAQHHGVGWRLMTAAMAALTPAYPRIYLEVLAANRSAQAFYHQLGFTQKGTVHTRTVPQGKISVVELIVDA